MEFPKRIMSITELTKMGFSREYLYQMSHRKGASEYTRRSGSRGKILIDTKSFDEYLAREVRK